MPPVDDRRVPRGIIHVLKRGRQWRDAPAEYECFDNIFKELSPREVPE